MGEISLGDLVGAASSGVRRYDSSSSTSMDISFWGGGGIGSGAGDAVGDATVYFGDSQEGFAEASDMRGSKLW